MKIKVLPLVLALSFVLAGCNSTEDSKGDSKTESNNSSDTTSSVAEKVSNPKARISVEGNKFVVDGNEWWSNGVNTPWNNWNDFGGDFDPNFWDGHFSELQMAGVNSTRIWINCDGDCAVKLNEDGTVASVSEEHWEDLDMLFDIAEKYEIYVMPTLISFDHFKANNYEQWRAMISSEAGIDSFVNDYVGKFVERYKDENYIFAIDLINEPDWVYENTECGKIEWEHLSTYFAKAAAKIHEESDILVTVGLGMIKYNSDQESCMGNKVSDSFLQELSGDENSYLDFYSTHYYDWEKQHWGVPFEMTPEEFGLDNTKPCMIGEASANDFNESDLMLADKYKQSYENGWCGVMAWTSNFVDANGGMSDVAPASQQMLELIPDLIYPLDKKE